MSESPTIDEIIENKINDVIEKLLDEAAEGDGRLADIIHQYVLNHLDVSIECNSSNWSNSHEITVSIFMDNTLINKSVTTLST